MIWLNEKIAWNSYVWRLHLHSIKIYKENHHLIGFHSKRMAPLSGNIGYMHVHAVSAQHKDYLHEWWGLYLWLIAYDTESTFTRRSLPPNNKILKSVWRGRIVLALLVCDLTRTPVVINCKHKDSCVHFSGISTCRRTSRRLFHIHSVHRY